MTKTLFRNGTVLSYDDTPQSIKVIRNGSILVDGDKISDIGANVETPADAEIVDVTGKIVTPGFINTHSHLWQTVYRTIAPNTTLASYFMHLNQSSPAIKSFSPEDVYISCLEGYYEGLNAGTTTWVEHAHNNWSMDVIKRGYEAATNGGARVWWCMAVEDREGCSLDDQLKFIGSLGDRSENNNSLVSLGIAYDTVTYMSPEKHERIKNTVKELNVKAVTIHHLGGPWPVGHNGPNVAAEKGLQDLDIPVVFSHCGLITNPEIDTIRKHDWNVSITPESEMHYGHGQQTSRLCQDHASLGVDTNWTFSGDIISQARLWLQSVRNASYNNLLDTGKIPRQSPMTVEDAFLLATRQGGRALHRDDIGVLKVGAKADVVCFDGDSPNMIGWTDPIAAVVLHSNVGDVKDVMVGGEFRKRDGKLVMKGGDWASFSKKFSQIARRIQGENATAPIVGDKMFGMADTAVPEIMTTWR